MRWRLFVNSLRTTRGKLELVSRGVVWLAFAIVGFGGAAGMGTAAFFFVSQGKPEMLAVLLWPILFFWQVFPIMATAFTNNPDSSNLLRFPLNYSSYFLVRLAYGAADPATALGSLWSFGILLGVGLARPRLLPWTLLVLLAVRRLQSCVHANDIRLGGTLAGAAPHAGDHGRSVSSSCC